MPTYRYECKNCGYQFTEFQNMNDKHLRKCPECGKLQLQRLIGKGMGVIYKGSGFYTTDYNKKQAPKDTKPKSKNTQSKTTKKSETKKSQSSK